MNYKEMADLIARKVRDPGDWLVTIRMLIERAGGDVTRLVPIGGSLFSLHTVCYKVLDETSKYGSIHAKFLTVLDEWGKE